MKTHTLQLCYFALLGVLSRATLLVSDYFDVSGSLTGSTLTITATCKTGSWYALAFGTTMTNTDMLIFETNGGASISDRYATGQSTPSSSEAQSWTLSSSTTSGTNTVFTVTRALNTGESTDYAVTTGSTVAMAFAWGSGSLAYHGVSNKGTTSMTVTTGGAVSFSDPVTVNDTFKTHGYLLYFSWGVVSILVIASNRYLKTFYIARQLIHTITGVIVIAMHAAGVAVLDDDGAPQAYAIGDSHESLGSLTGSFMYIITGIGVFDRGLMIFCKSRLRIMILLKDLHRWAGTALVIFAQMATLTGLYNYGAKVKELFFLHIALMVLFFGACEIAYYYYGCVKSLKGLMKPKVDRKFTKTQFQDLVARGQQLATFEGYVVDMSWYGIDHPGGKYLIDAVVGQDLGKYIYSNYVLESSSMKPNMHSRYTYWILEKLAIGTLDEEDTTAYIGTPTEAAEQTNFKIPESTEIAKGVYRVPFSSEDIRAAQFYPGVRYSGQHFTVQSQANFVARNYTICNAMNAKLYELHKGLIRRANGVEESV